MDGDYCRDDGVFFRITGALVRTAGREVASWGQPLIQEADSNVLILFRCSTRDAWLIQAKAEPGTQSPGCVLLAPTIQVSLSNANQAHGGRSPHLMGQSMPNSFIDQCMDGGRFLWKVDRFGVCHLNHEIDLPNDNFRWATSQELIQAMKAGACNQHLVMAMAYYVLS